MKRPWDVRQYRFWLGGAGLVLCLFAACQAPPTEAPEHITIGLLVDNDRPIHQPVLNAARLAIEEINHGGGLEVDNRRLPVELAVEDAISSPEQASRAAHRLINQHRVSAVIGCNLSRNAIPVGEVAQRAGIPMISPASTHRRTTENRSFVFRVAFTNAFQGKAMARFAYTDLGLRRLAILFNAADVYSVAVQEAFRAELESLGGEVIALRSFTRREDDLRPALTALAAQAPDALFLPVYSLDVAAIGRQIDELSLDFQLLGSEGWTTEFLVGKPGLDGAFALQHWHVDAIANNLQARRFAEHYEQQHGTPAIGMSALTFDAFGLLFQAIERAGSIAPEDVRRQLATTENFAGTTGSLTYRDQEGNPLKSAIIVQMVDHEIIFRQRIEP